MGSVECVATLPASFCCAGSVQELSLVLTDVAGEFSIQLDPAIFSNLKKLWMRSTYQAQIHIPASVHLASLQLYARKLGLSFENAEVSCRHLTDVIVLHRYTLGVFEPLQKAMPESGIHIRLLKYQPDFYLVTCKPLSPREDTCEFKKYMRIFQGAQPSCSCMMCWACTRPD